MTDVIGSLAYKLRLDSSEFRTGMIATRAEFTAAKAIARDSATGLDVYSKSAKNLDVLLSKGLINDIQHGAAKEKLTHSYLEQEATVRRLNSAELAHLKTLRDAHAAVETTANDEHKLTRAYLEQEAKVRQLTTSEVARLKTLRDSSSAIKTTAQEEARHSQMLQRGRDITEQNRSAQDRLNRSLAEARKLYREGMISVGTYTKHVSELKKNAGGPGMFAGVGATMKGTLGAIGAAAGVSSLIGVGKDAIKMTADVERSQAAMEAFTGSAGKAATMLSEIRKLSSLAGIGFRALNDGASAMMGYGVSTEETTKKLRQFAEISRGDSDRFKSLALAFGQVNAAGRLMGQEVLQMVNAGFNPLQEIARTTGIEFATLKKMMENGQVSVDMVSKAFDSATSAGGRFNGMMDSISKTSAGALGRLGAEWEQFLDALGKTTPATQGANITADVLKTGTTVLSKHKDQVTRRMEAAKKSNGESFNDYGLTGQTSLSEAATKNNVLDAKIKASKTYQETQAWEKQRAEQKAAEEARKKRVQAGINEIAASRQALMMDFRQQNDPQAFKQFNRIEGLLDGPKKKQATEDFAKFGNINRILPLLDRELQIEEMKLHAMEKQNAARKALLEDKSKFVDKKPTDQLKGPPTTSAGLTREQYEMNSYISRDQAMQAERELRRAEQEHQQSMLVEQKKNMVDQLPRLEQERQQQTQSHSPAASIAAGSAEAYKILIANQTRKDAKNDPQLKKMDQQISELKDIKTAMQDVATKLPVMRRV